MSDFNESENRSDWEDWAKIKEAHYRSKTCVQAFGGIIDFDPNTRKDLVGGDKITYDEYLDLQMMACKNKGEPRWWFAMCYYYIPLEFRGEIARITKKAVCMKRVYVSGMYPDGTCFIGKEDHVWVENCRLEKYSVGDCLSFSAEPYRYIKTGNKKQISFGICNLQDIKKIEKYELPSDDELILQSVDAMICESCYLNEYCYGDICLNPKGRQRMREEFLKEVKSLEENTADKL